MNDFMLLAVCLNIAIVAIVVAHSLGEIRDELRKMNEGKK